MPFSAAMALIGGIVVMLTGVFGAVAEPAIRHTIEPVDASVKEQFMAGTTAAHILSDPGYNVWGFTVLRWTDGTYHGYYARWKKEFGHAGWMTDCEIAHAVSDRPEGPFRTTGAVIASRNVDGWDLINAHNPYVCVADGKVCLYYIANNVRGHFEKDEDGPYPSREWMAKNRKSILRNTQCTGVAVADDPAGPFVRATKPVVVPHGIFKNIAVNPAAVWRDGRFVMIIKGDDVGHEKWFRIQLVGHGEKPEGPFTFQKEPVFDKVQTEDACLWFDEDTNNYNMVCHVMGKPDLAWFSSTDSLQWTPAPQPVFMKKEIPLADGTVWKPERVERPFVLTDARGRPEMIYVAVADKGANGNIALKVRRKAEMPVVPKGVKRTGAERIR